MKQRLKYKYIKENNYREKLKYNSIGGKITETEFIKFYKERNGLKSKKEAKEKIDNFWKALFKAIDEDKKVVFKNWGIFEEKDVKSRKIVIPKHPKEIYTQPKKVLKFRAGEGLKNSVSRRGESSE